MGNETERWCGSTDEEQFDGEYGSKEEAIEGYPDEYGVEPGTTFYVGKMVDMDIAALCSRAAENILDNLGERAYDQVGDLCDCWPDYTPEQLAELQASIGQLVTEWIQKYSKPRFYAVKDVTEHVALDAKDPA